MLRLRSRGNCTSVMTAIVLFSCASHLFAQEGEKSAPAAIKQYRDAVAFQNRAVYDLAADEWTKFLKDYSKDPLAGKAQHYLGICQLQLKQYDEAAASFKKAIEDYPASDVTEQSYLNLGLSQYSIAQAGKSEAYDAAVQTFETLLSKYPNSGQTAQALFYQAESLYARGKKEEAIPIYSRFAEGHKESPQRPEALYALGVTQEELNRLVEAGVIYDLFLKDYPTNALHAEVVMRRAETYFAQKQFAEAETWFGKAAATPDFKLADYALVRQGASLYELKKYPEAAALYVSVVDRFPKSQYLETARLAAGNCFYLADNFPEAKKWLQRVVDSGGEPAIEAGHWLAKSLLKDKKPEEALAVTEKLIPQAEKSSFLANLKMDQADALYEMPGRRGESTSIYAAIAKDHPKNALAPQALYMAAFSALGKSQYQNAFDFADAFLKDYANDVLAADVRYVAAESSLQLGKYPGAQKLYQELIEQQPTHADIETWKVRLGLVTFLAKQYAETVNVLSPILATLKTPDAVAEAQYLIGSAQLEQQKYDEAVKSLAASLKAAAKWRQADETWINLASALRQLGKLPEAKAAAQKVVTEFPSSKLLDRAHYRLGDIAYAQNDYKTAEAEYRTVIEKWPTSSVAPNALYSLGWAQIGEQKYEDAIHTLTAMIEKYSDNSLVPRGRYARAIARQQTKEFAPAIEDLQVFLQSSPSATEKGDAMYLVGLCQAGLQEHGVAVKTFNQLLAEDPQYAGLDKVLYELGWTLKSEKKDVEASAAFSRLATERPDSPLAAECLYHVGEAQYAAKDFSAAANSYFAAMDKATKSKAKGDLAEKAAHKLAWAYYQQGEFDKAAKSFEYQTATFRGGELEADALFMTAESRFKQNQFPAALSAYNKSLAKPPANQDFQVLAALHAGQSAAQSKKWNDSLALLEKGASQFKESPYFPELLYEQAWALQNLGKVDDAFKLYQQVTLATEREVGARARFMMGEIEFEKKNYKEAVRSFFKVAYGYGYPDSPEPMHKWQANAAYEAARCFENLASQDNAKKDQMLDQAKKSYRELIEKYPASDKVGLAKSRLAALGS